MHYEEFSAEDFLLDEFFKKWLLDPDPETILFWESWVTQHPEKSDVVEEAKEILARIQYKKYSLSTAESEQIWNAIIQNRKASHHSKTLTFGKICSLVSDNLGYMVRMAAVLLLFLLTGAGVYMLSMRQSTTQYITSYGETRKIHLPDSSVVILNANSKLVVPSNWDAHSTREVWLEGEAFFHVQKKPVLNIDKQKRLIKFTVHTDLLDVNVLGTAFNVKDRKGITKVVLQEGQVQLHLNKVQPGSHLTMKPGELVEVLKQARQVRKVKVNPKLYTSWTNHMIMLDNTPLYEIASVLEDSFGYNVVFKDLTYAERLVTGVLPLNDVNILMEALSNSLDLKVTKDKRNIYFETN